MNQSKVPGSDFDFVPGPVQGETARFFSILEPTPESLLHKPIAVRATRRSNRDARIVSPVNRSKNNVRKSKVNTRRRLE
jgi:hypothetical protein